MAEPEPVQPEALNAGESRLENLFRVTGNVFSGSGPEGDAAFEELANLGIKTVVSADGMKPDVELARKHGIEYVHIPIGYDRIPADAAAAMAKVLRERSGPYYVHCHHGKHRGPALAAIALRVKTQCDDEDMLAWLTLAGVGEEYAGLWRDAVAFQPESIEGLDPELVEAASLGGIIEAMAAASRAWDRIKLCEKAEWQVPPGHADVSPPHEAVMLHEHFREMARQSYEKYDDAEFDEAMTHAVDVTGQLATALGDGNGARASEAFALVGKSCKSCHYDWRN